MRKLNFESDELGMVGDKLLDLASRTRTVVNNISTEVESLRSYWQGTANESLVSNINEEISQITRLLDNYESTGSNINTIANSLGDNAEENASKINAIRY